MGVGVYICVTLSLKPVFTIVSVFGRVKLLLLLFLFLWLKSISLRLFSLFGGFLSVVFALLLSLLELTLADLFAGGFIKVCLNFLFFFLFRCLSVDWFLSVVYHRYRSMCFSNKNYYGS